MDTLSVSDPSLLDIRGSRAHNAQGLSLTFPFTLIKAKLKSTDIQIGFPKDLHNSKGAQLWVTDRLRLNALNCFPQRIKAIVDFSSPTLPLTKRIYLHSFTTPQ